MAGSKGAAKGGGLAIRTILSSTRRGDEPLADQRTLLSKASLHDVPVSMRHSEAAI